MSITATMCCRQMSGMSRLSTTAATEGATRTVTSFTWSASNGCLARIASTPSSGAWIGEPTVHFLMSVRAISYCSPSLSVTRSGFAFGATAEKKLSAPEKTSSMPVHPESTRSAAVTPLLAGRPANTKAFSM